MVMMWMMMAMVFSVISEVRFLWGFILSTVLHHEKSIPLVDHRVRSVGTNTLPTWSCTQTPVDVCLSAKDAAFPDA